MPEDPDETTAVELPAELLHEIRRTTQRLALDLIQQTEAAVIALITRAHTTGWADGYTTAHNEPQEQP